MQKDARFRLGRFTYLRRDGKTLVMESPLSNTRIVLNSWREAAMVEQLTQGADAKQFKENIPGISIAAAQKFLKMLLAENLIESAEARENFLSEKWEFHDLLFHSRARQGRHSNPYGGSHRFLNRIDPAPAIKKTESEKVIKLFQPTIEQLKLSDISLAVAMENRRSARTFDDKKPIDSKQLGEFLYRTARIKEFHKRDQTHSYDWTKRPYPGAGSCYELEIYPVVLQCRKIPRGLYHYDPQKHSLAQICTMTSSVKAIVKDACKAAGMKNRPQILFLISARFARVFWKYQSIGYALILKDAGALYQTMYLAASAMGLGACAIGGGNSDHFSRATGIEYLEETSVGEFMLGNLTQRS